MLEILRILRQLRRYGRGTYSGSGHGGRKVFVMVVFFAVILIFYLGTWCLKIIKLNKLRILRCAEIGSFSRRWSSTLEGRNTRSPSPTQIVQNCSQLILVTRWCGECWRNNLDPDSGSSLRQLSLPRSPTTSSPSTSLPSSPSSASSASSSAAAVWSEVFTNIHFSDTTVMWCLLTGREWILFWPTSAHFQQYPQLLQDW